MSDVDETVDDAPEAEETEQEEARDSGNADREAARKLRSEAANLRKRLKELEAERDAATKTEVEKAREAGKAEARAEVLKDRALDKVEAKAAKLFADPEDARALLASKVDDFIDGDAVDADAIDAALADLLKRKPHLAVQDGKRFAGSADGGPRKGTKPDQLTRQDLKRMTPAQIEKAQDEGRLNDLMGVST